MSDIIEIAGRAATVCWIGFLFGFGFWLAKDILEILDNLWGLFFRRKSRP